MIGFASEEKNMQEDTGEADNVLRQVQQEDLVHFGMIPELVGRLPCTACLDALDFESLKAILTEPRDALIRQYQRLFELEGVSLVVSDEACSMIAKESQKRNVGARALRSVVESIMTDLIFELPDRKEMGAVYELTPEMMTGGREVTLADTLVRRSKESA